nr:MAG TPA: hypothetical protein [Caudoviricetes sp.]DAU86043.1 MAG TPA: hypothetical protein [Caudoviricetes sp.]
MKCRIYSDRGSASIYEPLVFKLKERSVRCFFRFEC